MATFGNRKQGFQSGLGCRIRHAIQHEADPLLHPTNTTTHAGKMIMTVFAGIAEFERDLIRERTSAGRQAARDKGVQFGRPRKLNPQQVEIVLDLLNSGKSVQEVARTFNVHAATVYRIQKESEQ
jgi:DNA invertase Pin-like site-specific DNA recombinase